MSAVRKITVSLPAHVIDGATAASGKGLTETIRDALLDYNHAWASRRLLELHGKVMFGATWQELRGKSDDE